MKAQFFTMFLVLSVAMQGYAGARKSVQSPPRLNKKSAAAAGGCFVGDVDIKTPAALEWLRGQDCIEGAVMIHDLAVDEYDQIDTIDLGELRAVYGVLSIYQNTYLKFLKADNLEYVRWLFIAGNGMLDHCRAQDFIEAHGLPGRTFRGMNSGFNYPCD